MWLLKTHWRRMLRRSGAGEVFVKNPMHGPYLGVLCLRVASRLAACRVHGLHQFWVSEFSRMCTQLTQGANPHDVWSIAMTKGGVFAAHVLRGG